MDYINSQISAPRTGASSNLCGGIEKKKPAFCIAAYLRDVRVETDVSFKLRNCSQPSLHIFLFPKVRMLALVQEDAQE